MVFKKKTKQNNTLFEIQIKYIYGIFLIYQSSNLVKMNEA